ncbi:acetolactate synthase catalytic subunit [Phyllobacterium sp. 22229]|uniref:Acetolactate synthase catalytic subunit n=1 Tax=Phyllobacterium myrsinacearum TaxID=28101 RepID=A0A2S9J9N9_9HYPH|nr:acetolactate synthase catalytic subunit [Phyllobacterium myrsinacearum]PRD49506.1 acetolactate synthase catalytic subunit [Phyllobacterium myrsinacearum]PWV83491.1 acetolactate synthase-1/2/3 large subunit [Phyllobacterium myrsinacearum]RZU96773.1 acetolactate synthase-1/2/3 large subunit [Phyllobacterium myrsinacearum]
MAGDASRSVAQCIALALRRHGVSHVFAQSLPSAVILAAEALGIRQIAYRQENMGGAMADGYARCSGRIGVVAAQNGPAAALLVPPLAEALKASIPVVALVQDVERGHTDRNAFQDLDQIALFQSCTKWVRRLAAADRVDDYVDTAFAMAGSGRPGPVALLLPADLLRDIAPEPVFPRTAQLGVWPLDRPRPPECLISEAASILAQAHAPIILAGGGIHASQAADALAALQQDCSIPVLTTNMGKGAVDEGHPLSAGVLGSLVGPGSLGQYTAALIGEADVVVLAGTRTNQNGTDNWRQITGDSKVIHIDIDPAEIGRTYEALRLVGDVRETLADLREALLRDTNLDRRTLARPNIASRIAACWDRFDKDRQARAHCAAAPIRPERVMHELQALLTPQTIIVADASYASMWVAGQLRALSAGMRFVTPRGLAGLGWGLPLALGAKAARPDDAVVCIVGDGGFAHAWAEMETMIRSRLPVTIVVLNNGILGFQRDAETVKFGHYTSACHLGDVDHGLIAQACGCPWVRIGDPLELREQLQRGLHGREALLIEVMTDPQAHPPLSLFAAMDRSVR